MASHRPSTWAPQKRHFRALRVPADVYDTLQRWVASPAELTPVFRLVRDIVFSNAVQRAHRKHRRWAAGAARDPHYTRTPETPGALRPILDLVDGVIADLERLITWEFKPAIQLHELDAQLQPTRRTVRVSRLDETLQAVFATARLALLGVRDTLREATRRERGRQAMLVPPFPVSALAPRRPRPPLVRRRDLERLLRDELLRLHPDRETRAHAARAAAARVAHRILAAIL